jgi:hypothetical protein
MPHLRAVRIFLLCFLCLSLIAACNTASPSSEKDRPRDGSDSYFPMYGFIRDQWNLYGGQPFTIERIISLNGKHDTSTIRALTADWAAIAQPFFEADISPLKYIDQYEYSEFDESSSGSHVLAYDAKTPDLATRRLLVSIDPFNGLVRNLYTERETGGFWSRRVQKLYYEPGRYISIQEYAWSRLGPDKDMRAEYRFLR